MTTEYKMSDVEENPINDFIDAIASGDFNQSEKLFNDLLSDRVSSSLEAEKISVADTIFNDAPEIEPDLDEE